MLKTVSSLSQEQVDSILAKLLPNEKSIRRRTNRLESFVFAKVQEERAWIEKIAIARSSPLSEEELDEFEKKCFCITPAILFEFELYLNEEKYWHENKRKQTPETVEAKIMENHPGRWMARFPVNKEKIQSRNRSGAIYDAIVKKLKENGESRDIKNIDYEMHMLLGWHPEISDGDRVSECRWSTEQDDWELVVYKKDGRVIGHPTKTLSDILKEGIIARSRIVGESGKHLILEDAFLGLLTNRS